MNKWCELVKALTLHLIERYGKKEVESWLFTLWNEPDTGTTLFGFQNDEDFYQFYQETYKRHGYCLRIKGFRDKYSANTMQEIKSLNPLILRVFCPAHSVYNS